MNIIGQIDQSVFASPQRLHHRLDESTIEFPSSVSSRRRGLLALKACNWRAAKKSQLTARDYVQDGLIHMWDGVENAGWGVHDETATTWKDLIGNCDAAFSRGHDGTGLNPSAYWTENAYVFPESCSTAMFDANLGNSLYLSFTYSELRTISTYYAFYDTYDDWCNFYFANGWFQRANGVVGDFKSTDKGFFTPSGCLVHYFTPEISGLRGYSGGVSNKLPVGGGEAKRWAIGGPYGSNFFTGKMHCVRIYNRVLTDEEYLHNYSVDKARFGLA